MHRVVVILVCLSALVGIGCGKDTAKKVTKSLKVDCDQMCKKTFRTCITEVLRDANKMKPKTIEMLKKSGSWKKVQDKGFEACAKACKAKKGYGRDAAAINKCLDLKDCSAYSKCIKEHIK